MAERENPPPQPDDVPEDGQGTPKKRPHRSTSQGFRDQRASVLNAALRENLRRRKQAAQAPDSAAPEDGTSETDKPDGE